MSHPEESKDLRLPCQHLRSKEMYYQGYGQPEDEFSSGIYWCQRTSENFGPDGRPAEKRECCAGRGCYVG